MTFLSLEFFVFFGFCFLSLLVLSIPAQNRFLIVASYLFYATFGWKFALLLFVSTYISFYSGLKISEESSAGKKLLYLRLGVIFELAILAFFKYFNFFSENLEIVLSRFGIQAGYLVTSIALPLGISYYTFQAISYIVDVYREHRSPTKSFADFMLFKSFFPILFSGPIERAGHLMPQIEKRPPIDEEAILKGLYLLLWGLFKKVVIADHLAPQVNESFANYQTLTAAETWVAGYSFAFQLYCDFSGYTDIARGLAKMLGFDLVTNFNYPFLSSNPRDFWRRWHISLSSWFSDYVFNPLYFSTKRMYLSLFLTFFGVGIWHGASWNFVILGIYNGAILCGYTFLEPRIRFLLYPRSEQLRILVSVLSIFIMFHVTCINLILFRSQSLHQIQVLMGNIFSTNYVLTGLFSNHLATLVFFIAPLAIVEYIQIRQKNEFFLLRYNGRIQFACLLLISAFTLYVYYFVDLARPQPNEFIYFQF